MLLSLAVCMCPCIFWNCITDDIYLFSSSRHCELGGIAIQFRYHFERKRLPGEGSSTTASCLGIRIEDEIRKTHGIKI